MRYKVGDKVRIREDLIISKRYNGLSFVPSMEQYKGKVATITNIEFGYYCIDLDNKSWHWTNEMFEEFEDIKTQPLTVADVLNKTDVEDSGLIIAIYYPNAYFETTIGHNKINRNSELYKRFIDAYGDMIVDEISFDIKNDNMIVMRIKVDYAD